MNIITKLYNRLKAEYVWAKMGIYTQFMYNRRKPVIVFKPTNRGGKYRNSVMWQ